MRISILGLPGAGKTTLATTLSNMFNIIYISSGNLAREHGFTGSQAERDGKLDPNEEKIRELIKRAVGDSKMYILDGFPRMISQVEEVNITIDATLYLNLGVQSHIGAARIKKRGRPDDTTEIILNRVKTYYEHTDPLVDYFLDKDKLIYIDATRSISEVLRQSVIRLANFGLTDAIYHVNTLKKGFLNEQTKKDRPINKEGKTGAG